MKQIKSFGQYQLQKLFESVTSEVEDVKQEVESVTQELGEEGADDDTVKAALLLQAIDNDGNLEEVDIDRLKADVREGIANRGTPLNESAAGILHTLEVIGNVLGNMGLVEWICEKVEHATGKKPDASKVQQFMLKALDIMKKVTGLPARALEKFFEFIGHKAGMNSAGRKGLELVGMAIVIVFFMTLGIMHFPVLGSSLLMGILSITGLIGKTTELVRIAKEIVFLITKAGSQEAEDTIEGVTADELEKMAGASA